MIRIKRLSLVFLVIIEVLLAMLFLVSIPISIIFGTIFFAVPFVALVFLIKKINLSIKLTPIEIKSVKKDTEVKSDNNITHSIETTIPDSNVILNEISDLTLSRDNESNIDNIPEPVLETTLDLAEIEITPEKVIDSVPAEIKFEDQSKVTTQEDIVTSSEEVNFTSYVVGLKFEKREAKLKKIINTLIKEEYYFPLYGDLTTKEIKEDLEYMDKVWQLSYETLPWATLIHEPDNEFDSNAIAVYVGISEEESFKVGYIPKTHNKQIIKIWNNQELTTINAIICGGKYKHFEFDEYGDEKLRTSTSPYSLDLSLTFK